MSKTFQTITTIIIAILAFFTILFTVMGIFEMADGMRLYTVSEDSFIYALEDGRYGDLVESYHRNLVSDVKATDTMKECYAIAKIPKTVNIMVKKARMAIIMVVIVWKVLLMFLKPPFNKYLFFRRREFSE